MSGSKEMSGSRGTKSAAQAHTCRRVSTQIRPCYTAALPVLLLPAGFLPGNTGMSPCAQKQGVRQTCIPLFTGHTAPGPLESRVCGLLEPQLRGLLDSHLPGVLVHG
eukprot:349946-Chlamydomonas_euryale.AAC.8